MTNRNFVDLGTAVKREKYIASYQKIHRFTAEVTDGLLRIEPQASHTFGRGLCFLVVYPEQRSLGLRRRQGRVEGLPT